MSHSHLEKLLTGRWIDGITVVFAALAWGATVLQLARGFLNPEPLIQASIFVISLAAFTFFTRWTPKVAPQFSWHSQIPQRYQLFFILLLGTILRVIWAVTTQAAPSSDGATYLSLANGILNGASYEISDTKAYWPPGYPAFLAIWIFLLPPALAIPSSQIALFLIGALGIYYLTRQVSNLRAAIIATFLFAAWPNLIALVATPEKESLLLALLPWIMRWSLSQSTNKILLAGIALGSAVLAQPSLQLLIPAISLLLIMRNGTQSLKKTAIFLIGAIIIISPWTIRNFVVLGEFKLVSTNGGDNLYRANNKLATGGYTERGEIDLSSLDELEKDKKGKELATQWIKQNLHDFGFLAIEKQIRFMGDDSAAVYSTFRSDGSGRNNNFYIPLKLLANAWWLLIWLWMAILILQGRQLNLNTRLLMWGWIYLFLLHSVFESSGKYHMPMTWVLCTVLGSLLTTPSKKKNELYSSGPIASQGS